MHSVNLKIGRRAIESRIKVAGLNLTVQIYKKNSFTMFSFPVKVNCGFKGRSEVSHQNPSDLAKNRLQC